MPGDEHVIRPDQATTAARIGILSRARSILARIGMVIPIEWLIAPGPEAIRAVYLRRGGDVYFSSLKAGVEQWWSLPVLDAPAAGVVNVTTNIVVENGGTAPGPSVETNIHIETYVDGGMIGKAIQIVPAGYDQTLTAMALIRVPKGKHTIRVRVETYDAALVLGDITSYALFLPDAMAAGSVIHF